MTDYEASKAPTIFPYFGGKSRVAEEVWRRFGSTRGYLEPFAGSLAVMLRNSHWRDLKSETVNDLDGFVANFWRSVAQYPSDVAAAADWPVNQHDLYARHKWLREQRTWLSGALSDDPKFCEPEIAGVWVWGISQWIGGDWCSSTSDKRPHLNNHGMGTHSLGQRPHLGDESGGFYTTMQKLAKRLRYTRVTCCDWTSLKSTTHSRVNQWRVFLDPPYSDRKRDSSLYGETEDYAVADECKQWALELSGDGHMVAFCGQAGEHEWPDGWTAYDWSTGGYTYGGRDTGEVVWFSPTCKDDAQQGLF